MKVICEGLELSDAVLKVVKACSTKTTNPILECVKLSAKNDGLTLLATDGEIAIRKCIRAEVIAFEDMKACGTMAAAKAKGLVRSEGKDYVMKDGDIVNFLFNV